MSHMLVTGANGFVGRALCARLLREGHEVRAAVRAPGREPPGTSGVVVGEICGSTDWWAALNGIDVVIHTAARVHMFHDSPAAEAPYFETNAAGTQRLTRAAVDAGVSRLVFLSSIKVNGEGDDGRVYGSDDTPAPRDAYARSKLAGEQLMFEASRGALLQVCALRIPLVYGPGVGANFQRLMNWVWRGYPLPFGAIDNRRSLIGLSNLCDVILKLALHPSAAGHVWLASDGEDLSTADLVRRIARVLNVPARLVPIPESLLRIAGRLTGQSAQVSRLCGSLRVDSSPLRARLGWRPPAGIDEELAATATWFRATMA